MFRRYREILGDLVDPVGLPLIDGRVALDEGFAAAGWTLTHEVPVLYDRAVGTGTAISIGHCPAAGDVADLRTGVVSDSSR
jgi:hypothetical protein